MIFATHLLAGILLATYFFSGNWAAIATAALFSALPDTDMVKSRAGRNLQPFSTLAAFMFHHRGFLHSFAFAILVYFGMLHLFSQSIAAAAAVGYSSHLSLDAMTKKGIRPFAPFSKAKIKGFVKTGGFLEKIILAAFVLMLVTKLLSRSSS